MVARTVLTYDDLQAAPDDGLRRELLGGELYVSPAPSPVHQRVVRQILILLDAYAQKHGGEAFVSPIDVVFSKIDVVEPDVLYFGPDRMSLIGTKNIQGDRDAAKAFEEAARRNGVKRIVYLGSWQGQ